jgi:hypothetical protein
LEKKIVSKIILLCATLFTIALLMSASPVMAQNVLWVGPSGSDGNVCSQISACATFQGAINKGSVSQINCLGSGNYGTFTVTASITVDCGAGNVGNVVLTGSTRRAILLNTPAAATVIFRHLSLNGSQDGSGIGVGIGTGTFSTGTVIIEDCMVQGFANGPAINFITNGGRGLLQVSNSQMLNNLSGIAVGGTGTASVTLNKVELVGNQGNGLSLGDQGVVVGTMRKSIVGENGQGVQTHSNNQVFFTIEESSIVDNLTNGIQTSTAGSVVNVGASTIGGNGTGILASQGSIISFGNNQMSVNGRNGTFSSTTPLQ